MTFGGTIFTNYFKDLLDHKWETIQTEIEGGGTQSVSL